MRVRIELASPRIGEWYVISEGTYLVGFSGVHARELALKQQQELTQLLNTPGLDQGSHGDATTPAIPDD
jgi:hypothetical protein